MFSFGSPERISVFTPPKRTIDFEMVPLPRLFDCSLECESAVSSLGNGNDRQPSASPPLGREAPVCFKPNRCSSEDSRGAFVAASLSLAAWVYSCHSYLFASSPH